MEEAEKKYIRSRLCELCKNTKCGEELLTFFYSKRVLSSEDKETIEGKTTSGGKSSEFYKIIQSRTSAFTLLLQGLQQDNQSGALQILAEARETDEPALEEVQRFVEGWLGEQPSTSKACLLTKTKSKTNIQFDVHPPVLSFTGRINELDRLHQMVLRSVGAERAAVVSQVTPVSGLGGIGKTQLAREYVRTKANEFDGNVLWMNAESEQSLYNSFKRFVKEKLALQTKLGMGIEIRAKDLAGAVYKYFEANKALVVMDNAENAPWLKQFMPTIGETSQIFILITSRDKEWYRKMEILQLEGLLEDEAVNLIQQELSLDANDTVQIEDVRKLAQTLQCFPLALQQAIAYISEQRITLKYSIKDYLKEFESKQHQLLDFKEDQLCDESFTATTTTTWSVTFDKIKNDVNIGCLASSILNVIAYLGADNIKRSLFYLIPSVPKDAQLASVNEEQINQAVRLLVNYSMLNGRESQSLLSVHRLVQSVTRNQLARDGMEEDFLNVALQLLQGSDENDFPAENIGHALIVWRHAYKYSQVIQGYALQVDRILWKMKDVGQHEEGVRFGKEALGKFKEVLGEDHLDCVNILRSIGLILLQQGQVAKIVSIFQGILSKAKSQQFDDQKLSLLRKENLENSLSQSGKYQEALNIFKEVLAKKKTILGDDHFSTLTSGESYEMVLMQGGYWTEAETIFQGTLKIFIAKGDHYATKVLYTQNHLFITYLQMGKNEKALEFRREVYEKLSRVWVVDVDLFAALCSNLGSSLNGFGEYAEALKILEGNIEKIKERLGSQHASTLEIQQEIGRSYRGLGDFRKALEIFQSVHQAFNSLSGEDSLNALKASGNVAVTLSILGENSETLSKFHEIATKFETFLGREIWEVIIAKWNFALAIESSAENMNTALDLFKNVKASMVPIVGEDSSVVEEITNDIKRIEKNT